MFKPKIHSAQVQDFEGDHRQRSDDTDTSGDEREDTRKRKRKRKDTRTTGDREESARVIELMIR